ncbi:MAG: 4-hydroxythreonine-4-phosphate dehydrogenase PdxA [Verrucomicrobiota bacterium]|nr:4-hydroxythreonine-4-phosphate dehydrogenase PdxA [Verrucomicrobiota bacterium]
MREIKPRGVIGITLGDPAGIGPEIVKAALDSGKLDRTFSYRVIGSAGKARPGFPTKAGAKVARAALEKAATLCLTRKIGAVVTGPIHKFRMSEIGFDYPGQTEFFADRFDTKNFAMLLTGGKLTVALVTTHIPLRAVIASLDTSEIVRVGSLLADFLVRRGRRLPRIAVAGLNPHAGESGMIGREEIEIVAPAVEELNRSKSAAFSGPHSPDTVFNRAVAGEFDAVLCMYHDQGLIPLKLHAFDRGVNVTLGLPFVRTSPDHGTAFEIAGKGIARPDSMIAAIKLACELVAKRG